MTFTPADPMVTEGDSLALTVDATGCGGPIGDITYQATTEPISADPGEFGNPVPGTFQFGFSGGFSQMLNVPTFDDMVDEPDETFLVRLTPLDQVIDCKDQGALNLPEVTVVVTLLDDDLPPPMMSIGDVGVFEGDVDTVNADFVVSLSAPSLAIVEANFATSAGSATEGVDYLAAVGDVVFMPGEVMQTVSVAVIGDLDVEPNETFFVDLSAPIGAVLGDSQGQGTILNDDAPPPVVSIADVSAAEGDVGSTDFEFVVSLSVPNADGVTVGYGTVDGNARAGEDYQATSGVLTFMPGQTVKTVTVPVSGDYSFEPDEVFFVDLDLPNGAVLGDARGDGSIQNDDSPAPSIAVDDLTVEEGDSGTRAAVFALNLSSPADGPVAVSYTTTAGTATAGQDFEPTSGVASFESGQSTATVTVQVIGDDEIESDETFFLDLSNPFGVTLGDPRGQATIEDDDASEPGLTIDDVSAAEGDAGTTSFLFTVRRVAEGGSALTVDYATSDGTATAGEDYEATSGTLSFAPGETTKTLTVQVIGDDEEESDETFFVDLMNPDGAVLNDAQGQGTIENDDSSKPGLSIDDAVVAEGDAGQSELEFTVRRLAEGGSTVTVDYATSDGTATAGEDYEAASGTLSFAPGETSKTIRVVVLGDLDVEPDETLFVNLSNADGALLGDDQGQGTIQNDDSAAPVGLSINDVFAAEGDAGSTGFVFTVSLDAAADDPVTVSFATADGTAMAGSDYQATSGTLTFAPGETTRTLSVLVRGDTAEEPDETFFVNLSNASVGITDGQGRGRIGNDDEPDVFELENVGEQELAARAGEIVSLAVRVAAPVAAAKVGGVEVLWSVEGDAELIGGESSISEADGVASKDVQLGDDGGEVVVRARLAQGTGDPAVYRISVQGLFVNLFGDDDMGRTIAGSLDGACSDADGQLGEFCDYLVELEDPVVQRDAIESLVPDQIPAVDTAALGAMTVQISQIFDRLRTVRGHGSPGARRTGSRSASRLQIMGVDPAQIGRAFASYGKQQRQMESALNRALLMGAKEEAGEVEKPRDVPVEGVSAWGFFASGSLSSGQRDGTQVETGFDFDTRGLTAGFDYAFSDRMTLGAALGLLKTESEFGNSRGEMDVDGYSVSGFGTYYRGRWWAEGVASYGANDYSLTRVVNLPVPFQGQSRFTFRGDPGGDQLALGLGLGTDFVFGATSATGFVRGSWVDSSIDAYTESGDGPVSLTVSEQSLESLVGELGLELVHAASYSWGVLQPQLRLALLREFEDDSRLILARLTLDRQANQFVIPTDRPDRSYFNAGAGVTATFARGRSFFLFYDRDFSRTDLDRATFSLGLRLELP